MNGLKVKIGLSAFGDAAGSRIGAALPAVRSAHDAMQSALQRYCAHLMAPGLQRAGQRFVGRTLLDFGWTVAAAEVRQRNGRLYIEAPIERGNKCFRHIRDDGGSTRAAQHHVQPLPVVEHQRRRHRAAGALAGIDGIGNRLAVTVGTIEKSVSWLLSRKPCTKTRLPR